MPQSLSRVLLHVVFSTKHRESWLDSEIRPQMFGYLAEVGRDLACEVYRVGGAADHVHLAIQLSRTLTIADFVKKVKGTSSIWIKTQGGQYEGFSWQAGYGAFSLGAFQLMTLTNYIDGQEQHHRVKTFQEEYREFLRKYDVEFDERYVWD